jgi:hypothetical protein
MAGLLDFLNFEKLGAQPDFGGMQASGGFMPAAQQAGPAAQADPLPAPVTTPYGVANDGGFLSPYGPGATGQQQPQGLLSRLGSTTPDGINFADRLTALGSILQGDSKGAQSYLQNQRSNADTLAQRKIKTDMAAATTEALKKAVGAKGVDLATYLQALPPGADPELGIKLWKEMQPDYGEFGTAGGGAGWYNKRNPNENGVLAKGEPKMPGLMIQDASGAWVPNKPLIDVLNGQTETKAQIGARYRAPRVGAAAKRNPNTVYSAADVE